jgi:hypothetical protein
MAKIKIDPVLFARAQKAAEIAGYSSVEEFIVHVVEKEVEKHEQVDPAQAIADQLHGLGYVG